MHSASKFLLMTCVAIAPGLLMGPLVEAAETGKTTTQADKPVKKGKQTRAAKKDQGSKQGGTCVYNNKKWREGEHCMTKCDSQGNLCDMSICKNGSWKPYSSCFGPKSVVHNCPASCD